MTCIVLLKVLFAKYVYLPLKDKLRSSISQQGILNVARNTQKHIFLRYDQKSFIGQNAIHSRHRIYRHRTNQVYHMMMSRNNVVCGIKCSNYDTVSMQTL